MRRERGRAGLLVKQVSGHHVVREMTVRTSMRKTLEKPKKTRYHWTALHDTTCGCMGTHQITLRITSHNITHTPSLSHSLIFSSHSFFFSLSLSSASHHAVHSTRRDTRVTTNARAQACSKFVVAGTTQRGFALVHLTRRPPPLRRLWTMGGPLVSQ